MARPFILAFYPKIEFDCRVKGYGPVMLVSNGNQLMLFVICPLFYDLKTLKETFLSEYLHPRKYYFFPNFSSDQLATLASVICRCAKLIVK